MIATLIFSGFDNFRFVSVVGKGSVNGLRLYANLFRWYSSTDC